MFKLINVKPCKNDVGAFIDADILSSSPEAIEEMKIALDEYGVIFFRKQNLDSSSYVKFAKQFGTCADYPMLKASSGGTVCRGYFRALHPNKTASLHRCEHFQSCILAAIFH